MHEVRTLYFPVIIGQSGRSATGSVAREILDSGSGGRDFLDSSSLMALSNRHLRFVFCMNGYREVDMTLVLSWFRSCCDG